MIELITSITINLQTQTLTAYTGDRAIHQMAISSGKPSTPTPIGNFWIAGRYPRTDLTGDDYKINLPWVMCFNGEGVTPDNYCIHPDPTDGPLGTPLSRGCIRTSTADARWLFENTQFGTPIFIF